MSQDFKFKFEEMRDNDPTQPDSATDALGEKYPGHGSARNLAFVWPDGKRMFLNYSYLVCCEYLPGSQLIQLTFTTHTVKLKGIQLQPLFDELMCQTTRIISCKDERYNQLLDKKESVVNTIQVEKN